MSDEYALHYIIIGLTIASMTFFLVQFWRSRRAPGALAYMGLCIMACYFVIAEELTMISHTLASAHFWFNARFIALDLVPLFWFFFALQSGKHPSWLTSRRIAALLIIPLITQIAVWTNSWYGLWLKQDVIFNLEGNLFIANTSTRIAGPWFIVHLIYSYVTLIAGFVIMFQSALVVQRSNRKLALLFTTATLFMFVGTISPTLRLIPALQVNPLMVNFGVVTFLAASSLYRHNFLEIYPLARAMIIDVMEDSILVLDVSNRIIDVNPSMQSLYTRSCSHQGNENPVSRLIGNPVWPVLSPLGELTDFIQDPTRIQQGNSVTLNIDGRSYSLQILPLRDKSNALHGRLFLLHDITERKQAEMAIKESESRLRTLLANAPVALVSINAESIITYADGRVLAEKNYPRSSLIGRHIDEVFPEHSIIRQGVRRVLAGENFASSGQIARSWFEVRISPLRDSDQTISGAIGIAVDITEQKQLIDTMLQSQKLVELGTLAAGIAHEINTPLQIITGSSESIINKLQGESPELEWIHRRAERIHKSGWRIANIVRSLLSYARTSTRNLIQADLNTLVRDSLLLIEHQARVWSNIEVITDLGEDMPRFFCDANEITQVLINLLNNACDAMPDGGRLIIRSGFNPISQHLTLVISDTGHGIPEAALSKIFDPFFTTKPIGKGTGLGLCIVMGIIKGHGGAIDVKSNPDLGTEFRLTFPLTPPPDNITPFPAEQTIPTRFNGIE